MMKNNLPPKISVVIPLFNKGRYIARTIQSVFIQTIQDFEIIVIDGHSTDNGPEIVQNYIDSRIRFFKQNSKGVSAARNEGVRYAQSDYIAFLDADDEWLPCHIEELLRLRNCYPSAGLFATSYKTVAENGKIHTPKIKYIPRNPSYGLLDRYFKIVTYGDAPFLTSSVAIPKHIFTDLNGFLPQWTWAEDHEFWGRIALHYPVAFSWQCGIYWHHDAENRLGHQQPPLKRAPLYDTIKRYISETHTETAELYELEELLALMEIDYSIRLYQYGNSSRALEILKKCKTRKLLFRKIFWMIIFVVPMPLYFSIISIMKSVKERFIRYL